MPCHYFMVETYGLMNDIKSIRFLKKRKMFLVSNYGCIVKSKCAYIKSILLYFQADLRFFCEICMYEQSQFVQSSNSRTRTETLSTHFQLIITLSKRFFLRFQAIYLQKMIDYSKKVQKGKAVKQIQRVFGKHDILHV